jgi:hypothetical protein
MWRARPRLSYIISWCVMHKDNVTFPSQLNLKTQRAKIVEVIKLKHSESVVATLLTTVAMVTNLSKGSSSQGFLTRFSSGVTT